jgi:dephospho-CoA kinase
MSRDGLSETEARQRIAAQLPIEEKARRADCVIATDASFEAVNRAVDSLWRELANS